MIVYFIGVTATVWHLANGVWLFLVDWGKREVAQACDRVDTVEQLRLIRSVVGVG